MNDANQEKLLGMLQALGNKIGSTSEHLWTTAVRGEYISGWISVGIGLVFAYVFLRAVRSWRWAFSLSENCRHNREGIMVLAAIGGFISFVLALVFIAYGVESILVPEAVVIKYLWVHR